MRQSDIDAYIARVWSCVEEDNPQALRASLEAMKRVQAWRTLAQSIPAGLSLSPDAKRVFHTHWTERGEYIRRDIASDRITAEMLKILLPKYYGSPQQLYRGESVANWKQGRVGLCWTTDINTAVMFASGLNSVKPLGGVLLLWHAPQHAIITSTGEHSKWLQEEEYVADPSLMENIQAIKLYPSPH